MRHLIIVLAALLCIGCAQLPSAVPVAPKPQSPAVVFDIDGTLTPDVFAVTEVRPDAANAARLFADKGYRIIYLSARVGLLQAGIPQWLKSNGFPEGSKHLSQTDEDHNRPELFKARILKEFFAQGWDVRYGYGDSPTDFLAYADAGIPKERVFALKRRGDAECQKGTWQDCLKGWTEHLAFISSVPPARAN